MRNSRAVTLTELIIAVAIIVVLAAILVPAVGGGRQTVRSAKCQNNLRQIGIAIHSYTAGFSIIPKSSNWPTALVDAGCFATVATRNQRSGWGGGVFVCPGHDPIYQGGQGTPMNVDTRYATNTCDGYGINSNAAGKQLALINPSHILAADGYVGISLYGTMGTTPGDALETGPVDSRGSCYGVYPRHMGTKIYKGQTYTWTDINGTHTLPKPGGGSNYLLGSGAVEWSADYGHVCPSSSTARRPPPFEIWVH